MVTIRRGSAGRSESESETRPVTRVTLDNNHTFVVKDTVTEREANRRMDAPTVTYAPDIEYDEPVQANAVRITPRLDADDIAPEIHAETPVKAGEKRPVKLESKTKTMIAVYVVLAVVLAAVVFATGFAISGASKDVAAAELRLGAVNASILDKEITIADLTDEETIAQKAAERLQMGEIDGDSVQEITLIELAEPVIYEGHTNWFEQVCAFFSQIFG